MHEPNVPLDDLPSSSEIAEIEKRIATSTFPSNVSICLRGYENQTEAEKVGNPVEGFLRWFGTSLNLERLEAVTIAYDYEATLAGIDTGTNTRTQSTATRDGFAIGVGMAVRVLRDGQPKSHLVLDARCIGYLGDQNSEGYQIAVGLLAHEAAHVHDLLMQDRAFPGVILQKNNFNFRDQTFLEIAHACWDEYAACRLSARWQHDKALQDFEETFCSCAEDVGERSNQHVRQFRRHGDVNKLVPQLVSEYGSAAKYAAYLLGHLDGLGLSMKDAPKAADLVMRKTFFTATFESLAACLRSMWETYGQWTGFEVFDSLKDVAEELLRVGGIEIQPRPEGQFYVNVPFTLETM